MNARLIAGVVAPHWDAEDIFAPAYSLVADHARAGGIVLWNPWIAGGSPDFAEPENGTASPIMIAVGLIAGGSERGFRAYWLLLWMLGPLGLLVLARHLGAPSWGGFVAALGFAVSGFYTGHAEHTSSLYSISRVHFALAWGGALAVAAVAAVRPSRRCLPGAMVAVAAADGSGAFILSEPVMYTMGTRARWDRLNAERSAALNVPGGLASDLRPPEWMGPQRNNRNVLLRAPALVSYVTLTNRFHEGIARSPALAGMSTGADRIWCASDAAKVAPTDAAFAALRRRSKELGAPVVVVHAREQMSRVYPPGERSPTEAADTEAIARLPAATRAKVEASEYSPNRFYLRASCPGKGWLLVTERWAPGWKATVNGAAIDLAAATSVFRAVSRGGRAQRGRVHLSPGRLVADPAAELGNVNRGRRPRRGRVGCVSVETGRRKAPAPKVPALVLADGERHEAGAGAAEGEEQTAGEVRIGNHARGPHVSARP